MHLPLSFDSIHSFLTPCDASVRRRGNLMVRGSRSVGILVDDELFRKFVRVRNRVSLQVTKLASKKGHVSAHSTLPML